MFFEFTFRIGHADRGKQDAVQRLTNELVEIKRAQRSERFVSLQEQISGSVRNRANSVCLAVEEVATKSGSKIHITSTGNTHCELVITFKSDEAQVRIRSEAWDHTIRVVNVEPASTGLARKESRSRSWSVLEDAAAVERMLDAAFQATFN